MPIISGIAILAYVIAIQATYGWGSIYQAWRQIGWEIFVFGIALIFITHLVRGYRIYQYFHTPSMRFTDLFYLSQTHNLLNNLMPFRSGEVSFPILMKSQFDVSVIKSSAGLLWLRFLDAHTLGMLALGVLLMKINIPTLFTGVILITALIIPVFVFLLRPKLIYFLEKNSILSAHKENNFLSKLSSLLLKLLSGLPADKPFFIKIWGLTWLNWFIKIALMAFIIIALLSVSGASMPSSTAKPFTDQHVTWHKCTLGLAGSVAGEITSVLPINAPAGVGTYAGGVFAGIKWVDANVDNAMFAGVNLHLLILLTAVIGVFIAMSMVWLAKNMNASKR